ncbi:guanine nucleotide binding protein, alpha subunit [Pelagophyceae sp. CCMP2097]|nr:guanine nucleotide binding protein, alpha subunit [Pelagophyceae sp. CCMP2097]
MGACSSKGEDATEDMVAQTHLEEKQMAEESKLKLLLLGAGESGKSTVFKQMKILYGSPETSQEDKNLVRTIIYNNTITCMQTVLEYCEALEMNQFVLESNKEHMATVADLDENEELTPELGEAFAALWKDPGITATWERRTEFQIVESLAYYFDNVERISEPDYMNKPSYTRDEEVLYQKDALLARVRTSGIVTECYDVDGKKWEMYDVGGQRNERRKWIHCFENVTAVIFVAAISEYNQILFEDATTNRMSEALELFEEINSNVFFSKASMILFLNKKDLFEEKIKVCDIKDTPAFADYDGGCDYDAGCAYFVKRFMALKGDASKDVYHHCTCATDTKNVGIVFNSCKQVILKKNLASSGFM